MWNPFHPWSTRNLAFAAIAAALNIVLILVFAPMSYGPMQFRIAEIITAPFVIFFGYPAALALLVSSIIAAFMSSGMATIQLVWQLSAFLFWAVPAVEIAKRVEHNLVGYQLVAGWIAITTGIWVPLMLWTSFGIPLVGLIIWITTAELITMNILGYILFKALQRSDVLKGYSTEPQDLPTSQPLEVS